MERVTRRRITSPATMPRTPPSGLRNAVILRTRIAAMIGSGTFPCASFSQTLKNILESRVLSNRIRKCSAVIPDGPPAAPRRAERRFLRRRCSSSSNGELGTWRETSSGMGSRSTGGRLAGSDNIARVWSEQGALQRLSGRRKLSQMDQHLRSCGPALQIIGWTSPPAATTHCRLQIANCAGFNQTRPFSPREHVKSANQFVTRHQSTSWWVMQKHPRQHS